MKCSRCGDEAHDYGSDGMSYCSGCLFYGTNKQCWKCRMYLPAGELQFYQGQPTCQYCMMDLRSAERRIEEERDESEKKERYVSEERVPEKCERCGKELTTVYYFNRRNLCFSCYEQERGEWKTVGSEKPPMAMFKIREEKAKNAGIIASIHKKLSEFFGYISGKITGEDEQKRKRLEQERIDEKIGPAKEKILIEDLRKTKAKTDVFNMEEPDTLPEKKEAESSQKKDNSQVKDVKKGEKKGKGKKLGFGKFKE